MLGTDSRFVVNTPGVAAKVIDGEAIIMNLTTGMYFSMDQVGAVVWDWLEAGRSLGEIIQELVARYEVPAEDAKADLDQLISQAIEDGLISEAPPGLSAREPLAVVDGPRRPYQRPELVRYSDMADLLALDPPMPMPPTPWGQPEKR
jgi:hypothetical protein